MGADSNPSPSPSPTPNPTPNTDPSLALTLTRRRGSRRRSPKGCALPRRTCGGMARVASSRRATVLSRCTSPCLRRGARGWRKPMRYHRSPLPLPPLLPRGACLRRRRCRCCRARGRFRARARCCSHSPWESSLLSPCWRWCGAGAGGGPRSEERREALRKNPSNGKAVLKKYHRPYGSVVRRVRLITLGND